MRFVRFLSCSPDLDESMVIPPSGKWSIESKKCISKITKGARTIHCLQRRFVVGTI